MTDRYLFRGFHPCENGTESVWIEGKEIKGRWVQGNNIIFADAKKGKRAFIVPKGEHIDDVQTKDNRLTLIMPQVEVLPETVGQYIGITHNGKLLFEDDIINIDYGETKVDGCVIIKVGASYFADRYDDNWEIDGYSDIEVIGSIHSNPSILERKEK